jgi:hypothetical protein
LSAKLEENMQVFEKGVFLLEGELLSVFQTGGMMVLSPSKIDNSGPYLHSI